MMLLALLACLLLAVYGYACTTVTITMGPVEAYDDAQAWADELDASLYPMYQAVDMGIAPNPWAMPARLATLLASRPVLTLCTDDDVCPLTLRCAA